MIRDQIAHESEIYVPLLPDKPLDVPGSIIEELIKRIGRDGPFINLKALQYTQF